MTSSCKHKFCRSSHTRVLRRASRSGLWTALSIKITPHVMSAWNVESDWSYECGGNLGTVPRAETCTDEGDQEQSEVVRNSRVSSMTRKDAESRADFRSSFARMYSDMSWNINKCKNNFPNKCSLAHYLCKFELTAVNVATGCCCVAFCFGAEAAAASAFRLPLLFPRPTQKNSHKVKNSN